MHPLSVAVVPFCVLMSLVLPGRAAAQGLDGNHFLKTCNAAIRQAVNDPNLTAEEVFGGLSCVSYVSGFVDGLSLAAGKTAQSA